MWKVFSVTDDIKLITIAYSSEVRELQLNSPVVDGRKVMQPFSP
jgi:hypothetical protein